VESAKIDMSIEKQTPYRSAEKRPFSVTFPIYFYNKLINNRLKITDEITAIFNSLIISNYKNVQFCNFL